MEQAFLRQFLMISEGKTILFLFLYLALAFGIWRLPKKRFSFSTKVLLATGLGLVLGFLMLFDPLFTLTTIRCFASAYLILLGIDSVVITFSRMVLRL